MTKSWRRALLQRLMVGLLVVALGLAGCSDRPFSERPTKLSRTPSKRFVKEIVEAPPPDSIQHMRAELEVYQPQVQILSPQPEEMLNDTQVEVKLDIKDLPLFKDDDLGLGPHLHVILDNQPYQAVYDTRTPLVFDDLEPGTHTLRVFASRPWHESFKNAGAYAQVKFYVFTQTPNNDADLQSPLITYSRPKGAYGAEPIMLDFYLANTPLHVIAEEDPEDDFQDWQIRGTVNGQSFTFDTWEPIYLTGFEPGLNWIKLELLNEDGVLIDNAFNGTARIIQYQPGGEDSLSKLVRGELSEDQLFQIVDPDYEPSPATDIDETEEKEEQDADENQPVGNQPEENQSEQKATVEPQPKDSSDSELKSVQSEVEAKQKDLDNAESMTPDADVDEEEMRDGSESELTEPELTEPDLTEPELTEPKQTENLEIEEPEPTQNTQPEKSQTPSEDIVVEDDNGSAGEATPKPDNVNGADTSGAEASEESAQSAKAASPSPTLTKEEADVSRGSA